MEKAELIIKVIAMGFTIKRPFELRTQDIKFYGTENHVNTIQFISAS